MTEAAAAVVVVVGVFIVVVVFVIVVISLTARRTGGPFERPSVGSPRVINRG